MKRVTLIQADCIAILYEPVFRGSRKIEEERTQRDSRWVDVVFL
jgi:hypothetical protein